MKSENNKSVPLVVIKRLPRYYRYLGELLKQGITRISSKHLSEKMGVTASQIRQDLNCFGGFGQQGYGYKIENLYREIGEILGLSRGYKTIIVGAGNLGHALANHSNFEKRGFRLVGIFDNNPELVGAEINHIAVSHVDDLEDFFRREGADIAVKRSQGFALLASADDDFAGADITVVKGVHRLAVFEHDIVRNIDNIVDRAYAVGVQTLTQPLRRWGDFDISHHACGISAAKIVRRDFDIEKIGKRAWGAALDDRLMVAHRAVKRGGCFAGKTDDGVAVGAVIGDLEINNGIVIANDGIDVVPGLAVLLQNPNAVFNCIGNVVERQPKLLDGAEHTV